MKVISKRPRVGTKWRAKLGDHKGIIVVIKKVGTTTVALEKLEGSINGSSRRGALMRLPLDAFFRRYEPT
jgi:hypothetical protein